MLHTINNSPVPIEDVRNAKTIYGYNVPTLKTKTVRQQHKRVEAEYTEVPDSLKESIEKLTVAADIIFYERNTIFVQCFERGQFHNGVIC